jgi:hypothetical protein
VYTSVYYFSGGTGDRVRIQSVFLQSAWLLADSPCVFAEIFTCRFCSHPRNRRTLPSRLVSYDVQVFAVRILHCFPRGEYLLASCVDVWLSRTLLRLLTPLVESFSCCLCSHPRMMHTLPSFCAFQDKHVSAMRVPHCHTRW